MVHTHLETFIPWQAQIVPNVPPEERHAYEHKIIQPQNIHLEAVSGQDFRFDILGTPSSPWNKSAARVFANLAIQQLCLPDTVEMFKAIRRGFTQYLDTIIRRYKVSLKTSSEIEALRAAKARHTRNIRRRFLAYTFQPLRHHIDMLEYFGVDGMSSDESDEDTSHHGQYKILTPVWRASEATAWLRMFDTLYHILRRSGDVQVLRGAFPHKRIMTQQKSSQKTFVAGLPINVYDPTWLTSDARRQYVLRPLAEPYNFSHDPDIIQ
ncbi:hypothetical protein C8J57DRAFT_1109805 [Mycena rebaudengoi]|nr:hypothetical protein C8J57DRAFT_1109805 [Mycena rebaudengoi]